MSDSSPDVDPTENDLPEDTSGPRVFVPPPFFPVVFILLGVLLERFWPLAIPEGPLVSWLGRGLALAGLAVMISVGIRFRRAATDIRPHKPTSTVVTDGLFGFSRNPIYVSFLVLQLAVALILNSYWIIITIPLTVAGLDLYVIRREENYLSRKFGQTYDDYRARVRRWL